MAGPDGQGEILRLVDRATGAVEIVPIRLLAFRMAEIADAHRVSTLGAEAVAAAEHHDAPLCVWQGADGPGIRAATAALDAGYRTITR
ncbi:hypothetical protein BH20ACT2_BH20ACT2_19470 [soil metagenome]